MPDNFGIRLEYDETAASPISQAAQLWFGRGRDVFCADYIASIDQRGSPELITETPEIIADPRPLPRDPEHEAFGTLLLDERLTLEKNDLRTYSAGTWAWFADRIRSPFHLAWVKFFWLKDQGIRDGYTRFVALEVQRDVDRPGRFAATLEVGRRYLCDLAMAGKFIDFVAEITAVLPPVVGFTSEHPSNDRKNTAMFGGPDLDVYRGDPATLIAFDWLTHVTPQIVDGLGGLAAIRESRRFHDVRLLPDGATLLVATPTVREYTERVEARLGRYFKPVLPATEYWWDGGDTNPYRPRRIAPW